MSYTYDKEGFITNSIVTTSSFGLLLLVFCTSQHVTVFKNQQNISCTKNNLKLVVGVKIQTYFNPKRNVARNCCKMRLSSDFPTL